jgi:hypothetical protein
MARRDQGMRDQPEFIELRSADFSGDFPYTAPQPTPHRQADLASPAPRHAEQHGKCSSDACEVEARATADRPMHLARRCRTADQDAPEMRGARAFAPAPSPSSQQSSVFLPKLRDGARQKFLTSNTIRDGTQDKTIAAIRALISAASCLHVLGVVQSLSPISVIASPAFCKYL